jgi:hypothetical protein
MARAKEVPPLTIATTKGMEVLLSAVAVYGGSRFVIHESPGRHIYRN